MRICVHSYAAKEVYRIEFGTVIKYFILIFVSVFCGVLLEKFRAILRLRSAEDTAKMILQEAEKESEAKKREAILEAKEEALRVKNDLEREVRERRNDMQRLEKRLLQKEENLDRKAEIMEKKEDNLLRKEAELDKIRHELEELREKERVELERISGFTSEQAKDILPSNLEKE